VHLGVCKAHQTGPNASLLLLSTKSHLHICCSHPTPPALPTWAPLLLSPCQGEAEDWFAEHTFRNARCYVPSCYKCAHLINCRTNLTSSYCNLYAQMELSSFCMLTLFQLPVPAQKGLHSWLLQRNSRNRRKSGKLQYEHRRKKEKDPLVKSIEVRWFIPLANHLLNLQNRLLKWDLGSWKESSCATATLLPFCLEHHLQSSQLNLQFLPHYWS